MHACVTKDYLPPNPAGDLHFEYYHTKEEAAAGSAAVGTGESKGGELGDDAMETDADSSSGGGGGGDDGEGEMLAKAVAAAVKVTHGSGGLRKIDLPAAMLCARPVSETIEALVKTHRVPHEQRFPLLVHAQLARDFSHNGRGARVKAVSRRLRALIASICCHSSRFVPCTCARLSPPTAIASPF